MTQLTKEIGTSVISTIGIALGVPSSRFEVLLKIAQDAVNYQPKEGTSQEAMADEWNTYIKTVTLALTAHEAVMVGAIIALYLHEGIMDQTGVEETDDPAITGEEVEELTAEGEAIWPVKGDEGWIEDSFRDVT